MAVRVLLVLVILVAFYGCGQSSPVPEQGEKAVWEKTPDATPNPGTTVRGTPGHTASEQASVDAAKVAAADEAEVTRSPVVSASVQVGAEYFRKNCRIQTYIADQNMSEAEVEAFADDMRTFLVEDIEAGKYPTVEDYLDKVGVPAYAERCGHE